MALFRGIQEYIALDANNITLVFDSGNIVNISGNIFLYPPQGHPILYNCYRTQILWIRLIYRKPEERLETVVTFLHVELLRLNLRVSEYLNYQISPQLIIAIY